MVVQEMFPDCKAALERGSRLVERETFPPKVPFPAVRPVKVMVTAALAGIVPLCNVITMLEALDALARKTEIPLDTVEFPFG